jgi:hypothetical protein
MLPARQTLKLKVAESAPAELYTPVWLQRLVTQLAVAARALRELRSLGLPPGLWVGLRPQVLTRTAAAQVERLRALAVSGWRSEHRQDGKSGRDRSWF